MKHGVIPAQPVRAPGPRCPREKLVSCLPAFVWVLCVVQPVLDVTAYLLREVDGFSYWTTALRLLLLIGCCVAGFSVTRRKRVYLVFALLVSLYLAGHIAACLRAPGGYADWLEDLTDQARTLVLPITALCFMSFLRANSAVFSTLLDAMVCNLGLIFLVELLSVLTGTDPHTYTAKGLGVRGWFIWTSPQSAILTLLAPISVAWALRRFPNRVLPVCGTALVSFGLLYLYGTRLSFVSMTAIGVGMGLCVLLCDRTRRLQAGAIVLTALILTALYPISPMAKNRAAVDVNETRKQERITAAAQAAGVPAGSATTRDETALRAAYRYNLQGMIDRFGLEPVAERYGYTLDAVLICDDRVMKTTFCSLLMEETARQTPLAPLFGLEIGRVRVENTEVYRFETDDWELGTENYDPENDFYGVATLNGAVGLILLGSFLLFVGLRALWALWRDRRRFSPTFAAFSGAYLFALLYAYHTASTLRRNNASVYFAWVIAGLWYLSTHLREKGAQHDGNQYHHSGL